MDLLRMWVLLVLECMQPSAGRRHTSPQSHASVSEPAAVAPLPFSDSLIGGASKGDACYTPGRERDSRPRVAIALFGLSRNMTLTVGPFRRHVLDVLQRHDIRYDVFWSTMVTASFSNPRTKERGVRLSVDDYQLLSPCRFAVHNQDSLQERLYHEYRRHTSHDAWQDNYACLRNVLCSYYSQMKLSEMIKVHASKHSIHYDAILALRPDTAVISDIDLPFHLPQIRAEPAARRLWIPDFHSYLGYNDRAAFGPADAVHVYLSRGGFYMNASFGFDETKGSVCKNQGRHRNTGECFLKLYLDHFGVAVQPSAMRLLRTRFNGVIPRHDHGLKNMNIVNNRSAIEDYNRCVFVSPDIKDKTQNTFLRHEVC